jgi:hypothetical protein
VIGSRYVAFRSLRARERLLKLYEEMRAAAGDLVGEGEYPSGLRVA